jgi:hypothetical protein
MEWRERRLKRLTNRQAYAREASEFFAQQLMDPSLSSHQQEVCRRRLDDMDDEATYLEGAILRIQRATS